MIVLDTNVVLEILEKRLRLNPTVRLLAHYKDFDSSITTLTLSNVFYILEKKPNKLKMIEKHLKAYRIISVTPDDATWAFNRYGGQDFEDALQVAAAIREKCQAFLTLDKQLQAKYKQFMHIDLIR